MRPSGLWLGSHVRSRASLEIPGRRRASFFRPCARPIYAIPRQDFQPGRGGAAERPAERHCASDCLDTAGWEGLLPCNPDFAQPIRPSSHVSRTRISLENPPKQTDE